MWRRAQGAELAGRQGFPGARETDSWGCGGPSFSAVPLLNEGPGFSLTPGVNFYIPHFLTF